MIMDTITTIFNSCNGKLQTAFAVGWLKSPSVIFDKFPEGPCVPVVHEVVSTEDKSIPNDVGEYFEASDVVVVRNEGKWEVKTLSRPNRDVWQKQNDQQENTSCEESLFSEVALEAEEAKLEQAVEEFEEFISRGAKSVYTRRAPNKLHGEKKFHTVPRLKLPGMEVLKTKMTLPAITPTGIVFRHQFNEMNDCLNIADENRTPCDADNNNELADTINTKGSEDEIELILRLRAAVTSLNDERQKYIDLWKDEKASRCKLQEKIDLVNTSIDERNDRVLLDGVEGPILVSLKKRTRDVAVGTSIVTREIGVSPIRSRTRTIGVGGRVDVLERESSSPTGSLSGRRRARTFEAGIQVNKSELLDKDPQPPLLLITERSDFGVQVDLLDKHLTLGLHVEPDGENKIPKLMKNVGINVKPSSCDCSIYFAPITRDEATNTVKVETHQKCVGTTSSLNLRESKESLLNSSRAVTEFKSIGVNTMSRELCSVSSSTSTLFTLKTNAVQTEVNVRNVGIQLEMDISSAITPSVPTIKQNIPSVAVDSSVSKSAESISRIRYRSKFSPPSPFSEVSNSQFSSKPILMGSNTYTKEILCDEEDFSDGASSGDEHSELLTGFSESKYMPGASFDLSIPTIPERRETVKPTKEMLAALKVLNDALLRGKATDNVTSAIGIILHEWFRISASKSSVAADVEDYLDLFESYSPELLKYVVNMPDGNGNAAIHYALSHGNFNVVSVLLDSNCCDLNRANKSGYTCMMLLSLATFSQESDRQVALRVCSLGDVNIKAKQHGQTALMLAASQGRLETCKVLLEAGANINIRDDDGSTALMCAAEHGMEDVVKYFLTLPECDFNVRDVDGCNAMRVAVDAGHKDIGIILFAYMHFLRTSKVENERSRRMSYPPTSSPGNTGNSVSPISRSVGTSPDTKKKSRDESLTLSSVSKRSRLNGEEAESSSAAKSKKHS